MSNEFRFCTCDPEKALGVFEAMMASEVERRLVEEENRRLRKRLAVLERERITMDECERSMKELRADMRRMWKQLDNN